MATLDIHKFSNKYALFAYLWIVIWVYEAIHIFVLGHVPQARFESLMATVNVCFGPYFAYRNFQCAMATVVKTEREVSKTRTVEDRLDELERLKRRDMVTPEEYAAKRQEILKDL